MTDQAIAGIAEGLEPNSTLQELNLHDNKITDAGAKQLYLKAFTSNLQRKILLSVGNQLTPECKVMLAAISQAHDLRKRFEKEFAHLEKLDFAYDPSDLCTLGMKECCLAYHCYTLLCCYIQGKEPATLWRGSDRGNAHGRQKLFKVHNDRFIKKRTGGRRRPGSRSTVAELLAAAQDRPKLQ